jgi:hypothetical protein
VKRALVLPQLPWSPPLSFRPELGAGETVKPNCENGCVLSVSYADSIKIEIDDCPGASGSGHKALTAFGPEGKGRGAAGGRTGGRGTPQCGPPALVLGPKSWAQLGRRRLKVSCKLNSSPKAYCNRSGTFLVWRSLWNRGDDGLVRAERSDTKERRTNLQEWRGRRDSNSRLLP